MRSLSPAVLLALLLLAAGPGPAWAIAASQAPEAESTPPPPEEEPGPEAEADPGLPGEHHEHLGALVGDWTYTMRVWATPDGEPVESSGTIEARWALGARFVDATFRGEVGGRAFEGRRIDGYDNQKKEYQSIWQDSLATYTLVYRGECAEDGKVRTLTASFKHPDSEMKLLNKGVTTLLDESSFLYESFIVTPEGDEFKNMEIEARRTAPRPVDG